MIVSKPSTEEYRESWDRVFGREVTDRAQFIKRGISMAKKTKKPQMPMKPKKGC